ncbi:MAG: SPOR domain-containing protein [Bacteroidota bacterium]
MNLSNDIYLRSAFKELDAFAIAGIGTFRKVYHAAREETFLGEFLPPSVSVEFVPKVDEKLLLEYYLVQTVHLDKQTALHMTQDIRKSILTSLATQGLYEISGVGALRRDSLGKIHFNPDGLKDGFFSGDYFGLQPIKLDYESDKKDQKISDTMIQEEPQTTISDLSKGYWFGWKSAAILGIVLLFGVYLFVMDGPVRSTLRRASLVEGLKVRNLSPEEQLLADNFESLPDPFQEEQADPFAQPEVGSNPPEEVINSQEVDALPSENLEPIREPIASAETRTRSTESLDEESNQTAVARETLYNPTTTRGVMRGGGNDDSQGEEFLPESNVSALSDDSFPQRTPDAGIYHVISGSFKQLRDAQSVVDEMRRRGYDAQVLTASPTTHRVSVYRTEDRSAAEKFAAQLKQRGVPKSWIFHDRFQ